LEERHPLKSSIFEDLKVLAVQVGDVVACPIGHRHVHADNVNATAEWSVLVSQARGVTVNRGLTGRRHHDNDT
jgi:hypothetical protein